MINLKTLQYKYKKCLINSEWVMLMQYQNVRFDPRGKLLVHYPRKLYSFPLRFKEILLFRKNILHIFKE